MDLMLKKGSEDNRDGWKKIIDSLTTKIFVNCSPTAKLNILKTALQNVLVTNHL